MSYIDTGSNKPPLVLIHGLGSKKESWAKQAELAEHFRLIMPDLRGHGESTITKDINLHTLSKDIIDLLKDLGISRAHFCGLSLGGVVAQEILRKKPSIIESLILANTASVVPYSVGRKAAKDRISHLNSVSLEDYVLASSKNCLYDKDNNQLLDEMNKDFFQVNRDTYTESCKAIAGINYGPTLLFSSKKTLIIGSLNDNVTPYINTLTTKMFSPMSDLKTFSECGHVSNFEKAEEFNQSVLDFLEVV